MTTMIAAVIRGNATKRRRLRTRRDGIEAHVMAESALHEAAHRASGKTGPGAFERDVGRGRVKASWRESAPGTFVLSAESVARRGEAASPRRTLSARLHIE